MRRVLALIGIFVLVTLALTLLWRVHVHHLRAAPLEPDLAIESVRMEIAPPFSHQ
ncbi:MAG TPA: hypothetical protein VF701_19415 [Thermoanaerobaculia bacterium]